MKRYASHYIHHPEQGFLKHFVVEIENGYVQQLYPLKEEIENTEWLPGVIYITKKDEFMVANHYANFDFNLMKPFDETLHKLLL